tara:strand:+ start:2792 stop:3052 length:261 start_codon:yes stop_codon:yes gene_type:complete
MKETMISSKQKLNIQSKVFEKLILHLQERTDVQNIDLMNLSGFCRNCLSKWYSEAAKEEGLEIDYENSRKKIYGMSYENWKNKYQK